MFRWIREWYALRDERLAIQEEREAKKRHCENCDTLRVELNNARREKELLLHHLLDKNTEVERSEAPTPLPLPKSHRPWRVVQQELESKDRTEAARIRKEFAAQAEKVMGIDGEKRV